MRTGLLSWIHLPAAMVCWVIAATPSSAEPERLEHPLRGGAWAFQFQGNLLGGRNDFDVELAAKNHFSARSALRVGLRVSASATEFGDRETVESDNPREILSARESDGRNFEVSTQFVFYPNPGPSVNLFLVAGPFVQWGSSDEASAFFIADPGDEQLQLRKSERHNRSVGGRAEAGFEWFLARRVGLFTSYGLAVSYSTSEETSAEISESTDPRGDRMAMGESESSSTRFGTTAVGLGFSVYF